MIVPHLVSELVIIYMLIYPIGIHFDEQSHIFYLILLSFVGYGICYFIFKIISLRYGISINYSAITSGFLLLLIYIWFFCFYKPSDGKGLIDSSWKTSLGKEKLNIWILSIFLITCLVISVLGEGYNEVRIYWWLIVFVAHIIFCINIKKSTR